MKKLFYGMFLLCLCFIYPTYAETTSTTPVPSLTLNHLTYSPIHNAEIVNNTLYLSGEDLASMTYGKWEKIESGEMLTIQNQKISYSAQSRYIKINGISRILNYSTQDIDGTLYLPICILDEINYPYTFSEDSLALSITPLVPYSTATDSYSMHTTYATGIKTLQEILSPIMQETNVEAFIRQAKSKGYYISFMTTNFKSPCLDAIGHIIAEQNKTALQTTVHLRQLDCSTDVPKLSSLVEFPVSYTTSTNGLDVFIGERQCANPFFWATYNPVLKDETAIDLNKSLDAMIMRSIYAYYRDQYALKDDLETSLVTTIQMGRSDQINYRVYLDNEYANIEYQVVIYKKSTANTVDYYVDLISE